MSSSSHLVAEKTFTKQLDQRVADAAVSIRNSVNGVLATLPGVVRGPSDLTRHLGLKRDAASRLMIALEKQDPLALAYALPGLETLQNLVRAARERPLPPMPVQALEAAVETFGKLVHDELGGRHALDAFASATLPEERERFEMINRQAVFRAMGNLKGVLANVGISAIFVHPSKHPEHLAIAGITGYTRIQRLRPGPPIALTTRVLNKTQTEMLGSFSLAGRPLDEFPLDAVLPEFSSSPPPKIEVSHHGDARRYKLTETAFGLAGSRTVYFAEHRPTAFDRVDPPETLSALSLTAIVPLERQVFDVFIHRDVWPNIEPELWLYDTAIRGVASVNDRARDDDRIDLLETSRSLGWGIGACRIAEAAAYADVLAAVCERLEWDSSAFRGYRCDSRYPIYGTQYVMVFRKG